MRKYYLEHGLSINARTSKGAQQDFSRQKRQQVHAVTIQRMAGYATQPARQSAHPAYATDTSFGNN
jgi:hypothetical protein